MTLKSESLYEMIRGGSKEARKNVVQPHKTGWGKCLPTGHVQSQELPYYKVRGSGCLKVQR